MASLTGPLVRGTGTVRAFRNAQADDVTAARRRQIAQEMERIQDLYRWGDMNEDEYLAERRRLGRVLDDLPEPQRAAIPTDEALKLADRIGHCVAGSRRRDETTVPDGVVRSSAHLQGRAD